MLTTLKAALPGRGSGLPHDTLWREVTIDPVHLARYAHVCGFTLRDELPPTYPHVLAFPLHMDLLAKAPFSAVGVVHIANRIVQRRPVRLGETLSLLASVRGFEPHRRGQTFDFVTQARVGDELVWEGYATNLKRGEGYPDAPRAAAFEDPPVTAHWRLPEDLGRRYAGVSGDHNPIHLHAWSAKPFGFPRAIAHGMWTKARCLASLRLPDAFEVDVQFKQPILLPSTVTFGEAEERFAVHGHLEGVTKVLT
jgi:acyl dehydratase